MAETRVSDVDLPYDGRARTSLNEKSSDAESKSSSHEKDESRVIDVDPTDGAPWRWRIIAMLFALSLAGMFSC